MEWMRSYEEAPAGELERAAKYWWIFLLTGILWMIVSVSLFRFNLTTIFAVGLLFGVFLVVAGVNEFMAVAVSPGWRWLHGLLGVLFVITGITAMLYPGKSFITLAAIFAWYLLFKGAFDVITSILNRGIDDLWWLQLITGIVQLGLAFWAAGYFGGSVLLLIVWLGMSAMLRGITEIILAFTLRKGRKVAVA